MQPMSSLRPILLLPALLILLACSAMPAAPAAPATPAASAPSRTEPQPGPSQPAGATPTLGAHDPDQAQVDVRGRITLFHRASYGEPPLATAVVEGALEPDTRYARAQIRITRDTKVFETRGGKRLIFSRLQVGDLVEVTFEGPVAESDPVQAVAAEVVRLESEPVHQ